RLTRCLLTRPPPTSTLFPYTTLFRSRDVLGCYRRAGLAEKRLGLGLDHGGRDALAAQLGPEKVGVLGRLLALHLYATLVGSLPRSEEHTSELQSRENLVCRLLLEKKK